MIKRAIRRLFMLVIGVAVAAIVASVMLHQSGQYDSVVGSITHPDRSSNDMSIGGGSGVKPDGDVNAKKVLAKLDHLKVHKPDPMGDYSREKFGPAWYDEDGNGCDTRDDILARDLVKVKYEGSAHCEVKTGVLKYEPYTGHKNVKYVRGGSYAHALDGEHVVALGDAWTTGAQDWSAAKRRQYANDPAVLIMADPSENREKGDDDASEWLPQNKAYRCMYIKKQLSIKTKYGLWVTTSEKSAMERVLNRC